MEFEWCILFAKTFQNWPIIGNRVEFPFRVVNSSHLELIWASISQTNSSNTHTQGVDMHTNELDELVWKFNLKIWRNEMLDLWSVETFVAFNFIFCSNLSFYLHVCTWYFPISLNFLFVMCVCVCDTDGTSRKISFSLIFFFAAQNHSTNLNVNFRFAMEMWERKKGISIQFHFIPESWSHLGLRVTEVVLIFAKRCTQWSKRMRERASEWMCKHLLFALWNGCMHSFQFDWICISFAIFQFFLFSQFFFRSSVRPLHKQYYWKCALQRRKRWTEMWKSAPHTINVTEDGRKETSECIEPTQYFCVQNVCNHKIYVWFV